MALAESDDFVETAHIVEHFVIKLGGFAANIPTETAYRRGEEFRQHDADGQVRDDQRDSDRRAQRKQCDRVKHGGRDGDDNRRNGVREEDFQQFDVGGDQRDQVAFAFAGQFGGREATQRGKRFRPEQREQAEGDIVVHVLLGVAHAAADQCADNHGCDCRRKAEIPDFCASCGKQRGDAENRQERGGEVAEDAARAGDGHGFAQWADFAQQAGDDLGCWHVRFGATGVRFGGTRHPRHGKRTRRMSHTRYARRDATRQSHPFHAFLRPEQLGIRAVRGHEIVMRALLDDDTPIKHYDMVRVGRVRHAVRDHQHGCAGVGERANRLQNQRFAVRVDAAGRLVENIDGRPAQQYTGDRNALFLPAGQIRAVLRDRHIESSRLRAHEIVDMRGFQRLPQLVVGGVGAGHEQVVAQGAGEQVAVRGDDGDFAGERCCGEVADLVRFQGFTVIRRRTA